jgi:hypothetical protein
MYLVIEGIQNPQVAWQQPIMEHPSQWAILILSLDLSY